jgi:MFS family permease
MSFFGTIMPLLTMTLAIDNLANGFTRPLCGFISDRFGRENTMLIVFIGEGAALLGLMNYGHDPIAFMTFAALIFLCWGEIFSIFPALVADTFGVKNAAANCRHHVHPPRAPRRCWCRSASVLSAAATGTACSSSPPSSPSPPACSRSSCWRRCAAS